MHKENLEKSIGLLLRENGHELVEQNDDCIFYVKKISDGSFFYVRCSHYDEYKTFVRITLFFTPEEVSYENITNTTMGLKIPIIVTESDDVMLAAGRKIIAIEESLGIDAGKVIWEEAHV